MCVRMCVFEKKCQDEITRLHRRWFCALSRRVFHAWVLRGDASGVNANVHATPTLVLVRSRRANTGSVRPRPENERCPNELPIPIYISRPSHRRSVTRGCELLTRIARSLPSTINQHSIFERIWQSWAKSLNFAPFTSRWISVHG